MRPNLNTAASSLSAITQRARQSRLRPSAMVDENTIEGMRFISAKQVVALVGTSLDATTGPPSSNP
jgi:hypothetical protein